MCTGAELVDRFATSPSPSRSRRVADLIFLEREECTAEVLSTQDDEEKDEICTKAAQLGIAVHDKRWLVSVTPCPPLPSLFPTSFPSPRSLPPTFCKEMRILQHWFEAAMHFWLRLLCRCLPFRLRLNSRSWCLARSMILFPLPLSPSIAKKFQGGFPLACPSRSGPPPSCSARINEVYPTLAQAGQLLGSLLRIRPQVFLMLRFS